MLNADHFLATIVQLCRFLGLQGPPRYEATPFFPSTSPEIKPHTSLTVRQTTRPFRYPHLETNVPPPPPQIEPSGSGSRSPRATSPTPGSPGTTRSTSHATPSTSGCRPSTSASRRRSAKSTRTISCGWMETPLRWSGRGLTTVFCRTAFMRCMITRYVGFAILLRFLMRYSEFL